MPPEHLPHSRSLREDSEDRSVANISLGTRTVRVSKKRLGTLPPGIRIYAIGDIHGRYDLLDSLLRDIASDNDSREQATVSLVFLGDYVDRGPASKAVVERLSAGPLPGFNAHYLKGNHEDLLLVFLREPHDRRWLKNGGYATLASYGVDAAVILNALTGEASAMAEASNAFAALMPPSHLAFFNELKSSFTCGTYFFAHAGVRPRVPLEKQSDEDLIWIREKFLKYEGDLGAIVVHGHTPAPKPEDLPNRIGIDTQAWKSGRLTAAGFEDDRHWFLST